MVSRTLVIAATILSALAWAGDAAALSFRTFNFTGVVTDVSDQLQLLDGSVAIGTPFSGAYTFNPDAPDLFPASTNSSSFLSDASDGYGLTLDIGNYHYKTPAGFLDIFVQVNNFGTDSYGFFSIVEGPFAIVRGSLSGPNPIFTSDALPVLPPPLGSFTSRRFDFFTVDEAGDFDVTGKLTSLSQVPEPTTLLLFGTTMAGLGFVARRTRRKLK